MRRTKLRYEGLQILVVEMTEPIKRTAMVGGVVMNQAPDEILVQLSQMPRTRVAVKPPAYESVCGDHEVSVAPSHQHWCALRLIEDRARSTIDLCRADYDAV